MLRGLYHVIEISCLHPGRYLEGNIKPIAGIEDLLRLPGGCGEQSLIRFGPNVAIVKYLKATGNLNEGARTFLDLLRRG